MPHSSSIGFSDRPSTGVAGRGGWFLWMLLGVLLTGCQAGGDVEESSVASGGDSGAAAVAVSETPLRVVVEEGESLIPQLSAAWAATSEQPLEFTAVAAAELLAAGEKADVVVFRSQRMGDLQAAGLLTALPEVMLSEDGVAAESTWASLRIDTMRWGSDVFAVPLGAPLPALWLGESVDAPAAAGKTQFSWDDYAAVLETVDAGQAAEPLAEGWAGYALLARAASQTAGGWLFDRQTLQPLINEPAYVRALEQLVAQASRYPEERLTPRQIWERLASGELRVALGWPQPLPELTADQAARLTTLQMIDYPAGKEIYLGRWQTGLDVTLQPTLPTDALAVGLAASCRQTAVARSFMRWLAHGAGREQLEATSGKCWASGEKEAESGAGLGSPLAARYTAWLASKLDTGQLRPSLRLPGADRYMETLDQAVLRALDGELSAEQALNEVAATWEAITEERGREPQLRAWRLSQGMRGR